MAAYTKFQSPENCGGLSFNGQSFLPDANGITIFPVELTAVAISHGYAPIEGSGFSDTQADASEGVDLSAPMVAPAEEAPQEPAPLPVPENDGTNDAPVEEAPQEAPQA